MNIGKCKFFNTNVINIMLKQNIFGHVHLTKIYKYIEANIIVMYSHWNAISFNLKHFPKLQQKKATRGFYWFWYCQLLEMIRINQSVISN